jgi:hypothetical protein
MGVKHDETHTRRHVAGEYSNLLAPRALVSMLSSASALPQHEPLVKPLPAKDLESLRLQLHADDSM